MNDRANDPMNESMGMPMMDCESVMRQLWDFLDDELTADRMREIEAHVRLCGRCLPQLEFERSFLNVLAAARARASAELPLRERVIAQLRTLGYSA